MIEKRRLTEEQMHWHTNNKTPFEKQRSLFVSLCAKLEQARDIPPADRRRMEFEAAQELRDLFFKLELAPLAPRPDEQLLIEIFEALRDEHTPIQGDNNWDGCDKCRLMWRIEQSLGRDLMPRK